MHPILKSALRFGLGAVILVLGILIMNGLISLKEELAVSDRPTPVRVVRVRPVKIEHQVPLTPIEGRVEAKNRADILAEVTGVLLLGGKEFREGNSFKEGEVMMRLDNRVAQLELTAQRSQFLQLLSGQLADLRSDFPDRWEEWKAFADAIDVGKTLPDLPLEMSGRERFYVANRGVLNGYHSIRAAEERFSKYTVMAPFDGTVATPTVQPGGLVRAGQLAGSLIGQNNFEVKTALHSRYLPTIEPGDTALFHDDSGRLIGMAKVHRISKMIDPATQTASVYCRTFVSNATSSELRDGQFVSGTIRSKALPDVAKVPNDWIQSGGSVFLVENNQLVIKSVDVLFSSRTESLIHGLDTDDLLLAEVLTTAFDGMAVEAKLEK